VVLLHKHSAIAETAALAGDYCEKARRALAGFSPGPAHDALLDVADFCASRVY